jgi:hypothetical protein
MPRMGIAAALSLACLATGVQGQTSQEALGTWTVSDPGIVVVDMAAVRALQDALHKAMQAHGATMALDRAIVLRCAPEIDITDEVLGRTAPAPPAPRPLRIAVFVRGSDVPADADLVIDRSAVVLALPQ